VAYALFSLDKSTNDIFIVNVDYLTEQKEVLIELYTRTSGSIWFDNTNWLSSSPISSWYGIVTNPSGYIIRLDLEDNNLHGQ
jgi:hypothetical protein